jgi:prophage antirepressor-like protein
MKDVILFERGEFGRVRVILIDNEPWFLANDVAKALGYADPNDAVRKHCKHTNLLKAGDLPLLYVGPRGTNFIPESDLYRLIFRSNLPEARDFESWIVEEVLPSITKTGMFSVSKQGIYLPNFTDPIKAAEAWVKSEKERKALLKKQGQISNKREAKALQTASLASKQAKELQKQNDQLTKDLNNLWEEHADLKDSYGVGPRYRTVRKIEWLQDYFNLTISTASQQIGRKLADISKDMGLEVKLSSESYDSNIIKIYHISVIDRMREILDTDKEYLKNIRK